MAIGSLLLLLDDITTVLDDVAVLTKVAAKKTAGILGDDLALNAQQVTGVSAERELPVVLAVAKGSLINKVILVPVALLISYFIPWLITPLLMLGGAFLCFEGFEKVLHYFFHDKPSDQAHQKALHAAASTTQTNLLSLEKEKVKGAIRTDFILSAEIIVVTLGSTANATFNQQILIVSGIAFAMTVGVYGLVAGIVKLDDVGIHFMQKKGQDLWHQLVRAIGRFLLSFAPILMRLLTVLGTAAMFLVGGSIIHHGLSWLHHFNEELMMHLQGESVLSSVLLVIAPFIADAIVGMLVGACCLALVTLTKKITASSKHLLN
jgi:uncharacterized protein